MAEQSTRVPEGKGVGEQERRVVSVEILDLENHLGFYGRLFIASQAQTAQEVANIINPATEVEFKFDTDKGSLDKRNYNPVFKNLSFKERKDVWKEPYSEAKSKWLSQFTNFMHTIEKGSNRELALKTILPGKNAATFNEDDADDLFNKFCDGKSDVHKFTSMVVANLPSDKRNSYNLTGLVPDLQWIASGLFGRQTARMVANLVHLESLFYNNQSAILQILDRNHIKEKIRSPQDNESQVLGVLYDLIPQAERGPARVVVPATPLADAELTSQPAPVMREPDKDKEEQLEIKPPPLAEKSLQEMNLQELKALRDEMVSKFSREEQDRLTTRAFNMTEDQMRQMSREDRRRVEGDSKEMVRMDIANLRKILEEEGLISVQPQTAARAKEEPIPGFTVIPTKDRDKQGAPQVRIEINGEDTGFKWSVREGTNLGHYEFTGDLVDPNKFPQLLYLPEGTGVRLWFVDGTEFSIKGGKDIKVDLSRKIDLMAIDTTESSYYSDNFPSDMESGKVYKKGKIFNRESGTIDLDHWKKLLNPQATEATEPSSLTELRTSRQTLMHKIGNEPISAEDKLFDGTSREERPSEVISFIREAGGTME